MITVVTLLHIYHTNAIKPETWFNVTCNTQK